MAIILSNPNFVNQQGANPANQSYVSQLNFGQMLREVCGWNPSVDPTDAARMINNAYRKIIDMRSWYGLRIRGQIFTPSPYSTGTCTVTMGSTTVQGIGTSWTPALIGEQFRVNFTMPYQTIVEVGVEEQTLTLDMPYEGNTQTSGYMILACYFAMDGNIKRILWAVNQQMGWRMILDIPVEVINRRDTWRTYLGWSTHFVSRPPTPAGQYQIEIWPSPFQQQVFPFEGYIQPADMQLDADSPVAFIRSDLLVTRATVDALLFRPKQNTYYDPQTAIAIAGLKRAEFNESLDAMSMADNILDQRDITWDIDDGEDIGGGNYIQSHDV